MKKLLLILALVGSLTIPSFAQGNSWNGGNGKGKHGPGSGNGFNGGMAELINSLPYEDLSNKEILGMTYMYEEEKLARDVYLTLYKTWNIKIFSNIANSEQRHMDALKLLLQKYDIPIPVLNDEVGFFSNTKLQQLYHELVAQGEKSPLDAVYVGATIEDLDISDLEAFLSQADNKDIKTVYQNLMKGSRNHLRAFARHLNKYGESYKAQYLSQDEVDEIINSPMERGLVDENGDPIFGNTGW
ncbi:MAG: DUF2202 domain-containing protein [Candidatus Aminicenantes bacterium]|nr:DUF2202 domain-containing protein [Candidatus Aminicenantes bacterium]